jgi:hypothetical protein
MNSTVLEQISITAGILKELYRSLIKFIPAHLRVSSHAITRQRI